MGTHSRRLWAWCTLAATLTAAATAQCEILHFEGYSNGLNGVVMFRQPSFSGTTSGFLAYTGACSSGPNCAQISLERNRTPLGSRALKVVWRFNGNPRAWLRLTTNNTLYYGNPTISFQRRLSLWLYVPSGTPDFYLTLGVRETQTQSRLRRERRRNRRH
jgi:hypothetical protein